MALLLGAVHLKSTERHELNLVMLADNGTGPRALVVAAVPNGVPRLPDASARVKPSRVLQHVSPVVEPTAEALLRGVSVAAVIHTDGTVDDLIVLSAGNEEAATTTLLAVRQCILQLTWTVSRWMFRRPSTSASILGSIVATEPRSRDDSAG